MAQRQDLEERPALVTPEPLPQFMAPRRMMGRRRALRELRSNRQSRRAMVDSAAAHRQGKRRRGQFDRLITSPRHPALYRLAEYADLIEDGVMKAMDAMNAPPSAAYRRWPSTAPRGPATPGPQFAADTACRLMTTPDLLARRIAADPAGETAAALVYPDQSVRMLPDAERVIVSAARPPGPSGGAAPHPGAMAMMINRDIGSPPYRDLTAPPAARDYQSAKEYPMTERKDFTPFQKAILIMDEEKLRQCGQALEYWAQQMLAGPDAGDTPAALRPRFQPLRGIDERVAQLTAALDKHSRVFDEDFQDENDLYPEDFYDRDEPWPQLPPAARQAAALVPSEDTHDCSQEIVVAAATVLNEWAARMLGFAEGVTDDNLRGQLQEFVGLNQQVDQLAADLRQATGFNFYLWRDGRRIADKDDNNGNQG